MFSDQLFFGRERILLIPVMLILVILVSALVLVVSAI